MYNSSQTYPENSVQTEAISMQI